MEAIRRAWQRLEQRYTYRIPTAIVCTVTLLITTAIWTVATDDRRDRLDTAGGPETLTQDGAGLATGSTADTTATTVAATDTTATAAGPTTAGAGAAQAPGGGAGGAGATNACPEGLDKGVCTGITGDRIRVGTHTAATQCGAPLPDTSDPDEAEAEDWVLYINQVQGGVNGKQLELHDADDGYCPEYAGAAARQLIDEARAFAVQGFLGADQNRTVAEYAQGRGVPYLAGGGPQEWAGRWSVFHQNQSSYDVMYPAILRFIVGPAGLNRPNAKIGMMYVDTPDVADPTNRAFKAVPEANVVAKIPLQQGIKQSFLNEIREMVAAGVDTVYCNCHPLNMVAFVQQADAQGFKPQYTFISQGYDLDLVLRLFAGDSTWSKNAKGLSNFCHPSHPCAKPYEAKLKQVRPEAILSQVSLLGIHAIELFAEPMRRAGENLNRASYSQALQGLEGWTTGLTAPIDLAPDRSVGLTGFAMYQSPGSGSRAYQMIDAGGQTFRNGW